MKSRLGIKDTRPLADFLPAVTIAAKNLATEITNFNVEEKDLQGRSFVEPFKSSPFFLIDHIKFNDIPFVGVDDLRFFVGGKAGKFQPVI